MNPFEMVVIVVFLLTVGSIFNSLAKGREHRLERKQADSASRDADELRDLILRLEDRIRVLERIITDTHGRDDLRRQFRDLER